MTPYQAYDKAYNLGKRIPKLESLISQDCHASYWYAKDVIKDRFILAEPIISKDVYYSYSYARDVIKGRFILAEPAISKDAQYNFYYAKYVIKGRLPDFMHNALLLSNDESSKKYVEFIQ